MRIAALLLVGVLIAPLHGQTVERGDPPTQPIAYYRLDPARFNPPSAWLPAFLRLLDAAGVVPASERPVADGLLIASTLGSYPHRFALLDLRAHRYRPGKLEIERLALGLTIEAPGKFPQLKESLATILGHYGEPADREQVELALPGERAGVRFRLKSWPEWCAVEWLADAQRLHLGIGRGALERWLRVQEGPADERVAAHRKAAGVEGKPDNFLEVFADLRALRASAPTLFQTGRLSPMLGTFELDRTEVAMLHGRWAETFLVLDLTRQNAGAAPGSVQHAALTLDHWPDDAGLPRPPGQFHVAAPIDWAVLAQRALDAVGVMLDPDDREAFRRAIAMYEQETGVSVVDFAGNFRPYLLVSDYPKSWLPIPGTATVYLPLRQDADAAKVQVQFRGLMKPLLMPERRADDELGVVRDDATDLHWLDSPLRGMFKAPAWGWSPAPGSEKSPPVLIGSFSPPAVLQNREWLDER